jgi:hypothetical protein
MNDQYENQILKNLTVFVSSAAASAFAPRLPIGFSLRFNVVSVYFEVNAE